MPILADFYITRSDDTTLQVALNPPTALSGNIRFQVTNWFGGISGLIVKYSDSANAGTSGIVITDITNGIMNVTINSVDTSGMDFRAYSYALSRYNSGSYVTMVAGNLFIQPTTP